MFDTLRAGHVRENEDCEGFECRFDQPKYQDILTNNSTNSAYTTYDGEIMMAFDSGFQSVAPGSFKTVSFKLQTTKWPVKPWKINSFKIRTNNH